MAGNSEESHRDVIDLFFMTKLVACLHQCFQATRSVSKALACRISVAASN